MKRRVVDILPPVTGGPEITDGRLEFEAKLGPGETQIVVCRPKARFRGVYLTVDRGADECAISSLEIDGQNQLVGPHPIYASAFAPSGMRRIVHKLAVVAPFALSLNTAPTDTDVRLTVQNLSDREVLFQARLDGPEVAP